MRLEKLDTLALDSLSNDRRELSNPGISQLFGKLIQTTNTELIEAEKALQQIAKGATENIHQQMLKMEQAKLSFQFLTEIRNRVISAYQDLLREQI